MTTVQTTQGLKTYVTMKMAQGLETPSRVDLGPNAIRPAVDGSIVVETGYVSALLAAGWQIQVDSGTTHVP